MTATTKRKRPVRSKEDGKKLANAMFKSGKPTASWTEDDAKSFFNMNPELTQVVRGLPHEPSIQWTKNDNGLVTKVDLDANKVAKQLRKLAKALDLTKGEYRKLKKDYHKTTNRSLSELKARTERVETTVEATDNA